jgi:hypothetical protein
MKVLAYMAVIIALAAAIGWIPCGARTWYVKADGSGDVPDVKTGVDSSTVAGDTLLLASGVFSGAGNRDIDVIGKSIVILSESGPGATVIDCGRNPGYRFQGSMDTRIEGITIQWAWVSGMDSPIRIHSGASVAFNECDFLNNKGGWAGAVRCEDDSSYIGVTYCTFQNNDGGMAGAIDVLYGTCTISHNRFESNQSSGGDGAISTTYVTDPSIIDYNLFWGNFGGGAAGSVNASDIDGPDSLRVANNTIVGNHSAAWGAAIWLKGDYVVAENNIIAYNPTTAVGCAVIGNPTFACNDVFGNSSDVICAEATAWGNIFSDPMFCNPLAGDFYLHAMSPCAPDNNACGVLMGAFPVDEDCTGSPVEDSPLGSGYALLASYPNPFTVSTTIRFSLPEQADVHLRIYDVTGGLVATLLDREMIPGINSVRFDAANLPSGVYFYKLETAKFTETRKMVIAK